MVSSKFARAAARIAIAGACASLLSACGGGSSLSGMFGSSSSSPPPPDPPQAADDLARGFDCRKDKVRVIGTRGRAIELAQQ